MSPVRNTRGKEEEEEADDDDDDDDGRSSPSEMSKGEAEDRRLALSGDVSGLSSHHYRQAGQVKRSPRGRRSGRRGVDDHCHHHERVDCSSPKRLLLQQHKSDPMPRSEEEETRERMKMKVVVNQAQE